MTAMDLLDKLVMLEADADAFGFRWETTEQILSQIESECIEVREHLISGYDPAKHDELQEEIGDLLHAVFSLSVFCKMNPRETLEKTLAKFERRMSTVKQIALKRGLTHLNGYSFDELMSVWDEAKQR